ncbi:PHD finger domain protein [Aspergillus sp. HF37]|nr:PHD finger domain protein [Aspergillus sp. HF37]
MTLHNGIDPAAPSSLPQATSSSHPLPPDPTTPSQPKPNSGSPLGLSLDHSLPQGALSKKVQIPRLSPATTELLAQVTGSIQGEDNSTYPGQDLGGSSNTENSGKMKVSSVFLDLPTPPFASSNTPTASGTPKQNAEPAQKENSESAGPVHVAPKPVEMSTSLPQIQHQPLAVARTAPSEAAVPTPQNGPNAPTVLHDDHSKPADLTSIALKTPETPSNSVPQPQPRLHSAAPEAQVAPSTSSTAEQPQIASSMPPEETHSQPAELARIAPNSAEAPSTSTAQAQPQLQFTPPIAPTASTLTLTYKRQKAPPVPRQRKFTANGKRGRKRKRGNESENEGVVKAGDSSSDESDITPTATQTKSGRQVSRPSLYAPSQLSPGMGKGNTNQPTASTNMAAPAALSRKRRRVYRKGKETYVNCTQCQRGHSPLTNTIVFCDNCNKAWHQLCHNPPIDSEVVTVKEKEWRCRECKPIPNQAGHPTVLRSNHALQSRPLGPPIHPPLPMPQIEVGGEGYSRDERRGYLSSLSHATLVELLVSLSDRNPSVPMFPANLKSLPSSKFSYQSNTSPVPPHSASADTLISGSTEQPAAFNSVPDTRPSAPAGRRDEPSDESEYEDVEDHRLYPLAGNGFSLPLNDNDLDILQEDPACPTFSYSLHGPAKTRAEANEVAPVWGAA